MMKRILHIIFVVALVSEINAQQTTFYRTYGEGVYNSGQAVLQSVDSGYVVCGGINEYDDNGMNVLLFKTDSLGVQQWRKSIGGPGIDFARHFTYSLGGNGFVMVGYTNRNGNYDGLIVATGLTGDTLWTKVYGGADWDMLYSIDTTHDGNYIIAGETYSYGAGNSDVWVLKLTPSGDTLWTRTFGGPDDDNARWVFEDRDSNAVVVGSTESFGNGNSDVYVVYVQENGDSAWTMTEGTGGNEYGWSGDMFFDASNNMTLMIGGSIEVEAAGFTTFFNPRISTTGSTAYINQGDPNYVFDRKKTRLKNEGNGGRFYIAYQSRQQSSTQWESEFQRTFYGGFFGYLVTSVGNPNYSEFANDIVKTYDQAYIITGDLVGQGPNLTPAFLTKIDSSGIAPVTAVLSAEDIGPELSELVVYPNPCMDFVFVSGPHITQGTVSVYNIRGGLVFSKVIQDASTIYLDTRLLENGTYILKINTGSGYSVRKLVKY